MHVVLALAAILLDQDVSFENRVLGTVPDDAVAPKAEVWDPAPLKARDLQFSADGRAAAYWTKGARKAVVHFAGKTVEAGTEVNGLKLWPNGRVTYAGWDHAARGPRSFAGMDDWKGPLYDGVGVVAVSPDGKTVAYSASVDNDAEKRSDAFVVVGDKRGAIVGHQVTALAFAEDGATVMFAAIRGATETLYLGDKARDGLTGFYMDWMIFGRDGRLRAFVARKGDQSCVIVDGTPGESWDFAHDLTLGADGKTVGYRAKRGEQDFIVAGGKKIEVRGGALWGVARGPDLAPIALVLERKGRDSQQWCVTQEDRVLADGLLQLPQPVACPDGRRVAFRVGRKEGEGIWNGDKVVDTGGAAGLIAWSPDGKRLAWTEVRDGRSTVVCDGRAGETADAVAWIGFSPDSKTLAGVLKRGGKWTVVAGAAQGDACEHIGPVHWSPDSSKLAFGAIRGKEVVWQVVNVR